MSSSAIQGVLGQIELNKSLSFKKLNRQIKSCLLNQEISPQGVLPAKIELQSPCSQRNTAPVMYHCKANGSIPSVTGICYFQITNHSVVMHWEIPSHCPTTRVNIVHTKSGARWWILVSTARWWMGKEGNIGYMGRPCLKHSHTNTHQQSLGNRDVRTNKHHLPFLARERGGRELGICFHIQFEKMESWVKLGVWHRLSKNSTTNLCSPSGTLSPPEDQVNKADIASCRLWLAETN